MEKAVKKDPGSGGAGSSGKAAQPGAPQAKPKLSIVGRKSKSSAFLSSLAKQHKPQKSQAAGTASFLAAYLQPRITGQHSAGTQLALLRSAQIVSLESWVQHCTLNTKHEPHRHDHSRCFDSLNCATCTRLQGSW